LKSIITRKHVVLLGGLVLLVVVLGIADVSLNNYYVRILQLMGIYVVLTASLNLTNGFTGDFALGHAAFMAIGGYTSALLTMPLASKAIQLADLPLWFQEFAMPFPLATVLGGLLAALVALPVGLVVLRLRGHYLAVATLGLLFIVASVASNWDPVTRGARGLSGLDAATTVWWAFGWAVITVFVVWRLVHSPFGRSMIAVRDDSVAAASRGVRTLRVRLVAFTISAFFGGIGGALLTHQLTAITPTTFAFDLTFLVVIMLVIGGQGSVTGSIIGAIIMTIVPVILRELERQIELPGISQIIIAAGLIAFMIFRRQGIMGYRELHPSTWFMKKSHSLASRTHQSSNLPTQNNTKGTK
jgi:branched-chain amino acid transport system permease protein